MWFSTTGYGEEGSKTGLYGWTPNGTHSLSTMGNAESGTVFWQSVVASDWSRKVFWEIAHGEIDQFCS